MGYPSGCGASSSVANDGSGFVTGVAYYEMQGSKRAVERENEKLIAKSEKLKAENASLQTLLQKERYYTSVLMCHTAVISCCRGSNSGIFLFKICNLLFFMQFQGRSEEIPQ